MGWFDDDASGKSEEKTDWLGNKYTEHTDSSGNVVGRSEEKTDWLGDSYIEHRDASGDVTGRSDEKTDWLGDRYVEHRDASDDVSGRSEAKTDWLGDRYVEHRDSGGEVTGRSEQATDWLGDRYTKHTGRAYPSQMNSHEEGLRSAGTTPGSESSWIDYDSGGSSGATGGSSRSPGSSSATDSPSGGIMIVLALIILVLFIFTRLDESAGLQSSSPSQNQSTVIASPSISAAPLTTPAQVSADSAQPDVEFCTRFVCVYAAEGDSARSFAVDHGAVLPSTPELGSIGWLRVRIDSLRIGYIRSVDLAHLVTPASGNQRVALP